MLSRYARQCALPLIKSTFCVATRPAVLLRPVLVLPVLMPKSMPTPLIDVEKLQKVDCGTGQPAQRGRRKPLVWKRRKPWFDHQWSLDLNRVRKGPETPHFPDGVPFTQIRAFQSFAGRSWQINAGRRRKIRLSLKRGRRKLL